MKDNTRKRVLAALALALILGACDKELPDHKSGRDVTVRVRLVGVAEGGEEDVTRSVSMKEREEFVTPVGDGMLMEMSMERDTSALRANKAQLASDSRFRVIALKHNTSTFISYGDFTIADGLVGGGLHVPVNDSYDFVCFSYNTTTLPDAPTQKQGAAISTTIDVLQGAKDLLWTKITVDVGDEDPELEILLRRVMARVKVVLDLSYNKWSITGIQGSITLGSVGTGGTIRLTNGGVASNEGTPTFSSWTGTGYQRESTNELLVMPNASGTSVSIPIGAIERQGLAAVPSKALSSAFTELKSGYSYRLRVRLRIPIWAKSNIYWDGTGKKLTFVTAEGNTDKQGFQGVFFKWGSLVGVSPRGSYSNATAIYVPYNYTDATPTAAKWKQTTRDAVKADTDIPAATENWTTWGENTAAATDIPYMDRDRIGTLNSYLIDAAHNDEITYKGLRGDICQYLGKTQGALEGYRLPTADEFGRGGSSPTPWNISTPNSYGWIRGDGFWPTTAAPVSSTEQEVDGTSDLLAEAYGTNKDEAYGSGINQTMWGVVLPASGARHGSSSYASYLGYYGYYGNGSTAAGENNCRILLFLSDGVYPGFSIERSYGLSVRCVRK
jgi:hypothetical protein